MLKALEIATRNMEQESKHIGEIRDYMMQQLSATVPGISFNGNQEGNKLYTVLSAAFPHTDKSEMILYSLDMQGVCASGGSACSSGAQTGSHVISHVYPDSDQITVRFSFSKYNTKDEVDRVMKVLKEVL